MTRSAKTSSSPRPVWHRGSYRLAGAITFAWVVGTAVYVGVSGLPLFFPMSMRVSILAQLGGFVLSLIICVAGTIWAARHYQAHWSMLTPWSCRHCRYDMRGTDPAGRDAPCPECGEPWDMPVDARKRP